MDVLATASRTIFSFFIAVIICVPLGLMMGFFPRLYEYLDLFVEFFRSIPATALIPVFVLFFGIGEKSKIILAAWTAGLMLLINTIYGVQHAKITRKQVAKTFGLSDYSYLRKIVFPEAAPAIFSGMRIAISLSLIIIIVTEIFNGGAFGLGSRIIDAQLSYRIPELYASLIFTGLIGFLLNRIIIFIERRVIFWKGH
jgi:NitT/TauT family transport system permease protein